MNSPLGCEVYFPLHQLQFHLSMLILHNLTRHILARSFTSSCCYSFILLVGRPEVYTDLLGMTHIFDFWDRSGESSVMQYRGATSSTHPLNFFEGFGDQPEAHRNLLNFRSYSSLFDVQKNPRVYWRRRENPGNIRLW